MCYHLFSCGTRCGFIRRFLLPSLLLLSPGCSGPITVDNDGGSNCEVASLDDSGSTEVHISKYCTTDADCDDGDPCTIHECAEVGCIVASVDVGVACDDADPCTDNDLCLEDSTCEGTTTDCEDGNPCTIDSCDPETGECASELAADGSVCEDGVLCTIGDACLDGLCIGMERVCGDANPTDCIMPTCNPDTGGCDGVLLMEAGAACHDGNPCTDDDTCDGSGECVPGDSQTCAAAHSCKKAWCNDSALDGENPCVSEWKDEGVGCDNGDKCSEEDQCVLVDDGPSLECKGMAIVCLDSNVCTLDSCASEVGCVFDPQPKEGAVCGAGNGTCGVCEVGTCVADTAVCDDGNVCTQDTCEADSGCQHLPLSDGLCDDGNACTVDDHCFEGECISSSKDCDDDNPCTEDICAAGDCKHLNLVDDTPCEDGNACSDNDYCEDGICLPGGYAPDCLDSCGDGPCVYPDTAELCPLDCGYCGDGICSMHEAGKNGGSCPQDCLTACGDGKCQGSESFLTCLLDCGGCGDDFCGFGESFDTCAGDCPPGCGNGQCESGEGPLVCPEDCMPPCGNGICNWGENTVNCMQDCSYCGDNFCSLIETKESCYKDCNTACGNGLCEGGEDSAECPVDCGFCGDGVCGFAETHLMCPADCIPGCGDKICDPDLNESLSTCPTDCTVDIDGDGVNDHQDNCMYHANPQQENFDDDDFGDTCDLDDDDDGEADATDCEPLDPDISHLLPEKCDGKDNDCDVAVDEEEPLGCTLYYLDVDEDGVGVENTSKCLCEAWEFFSALTSGDCSPFNPNKYPGAIEKCNGEDDDCDDEIDEEYDDLDKDKTADCMDTDDDGDGIDDVEDNCPLMVNPQQENVDADEDGDVCDPDDDNDGDPDDMDCEPFNAAVFHLADEVCNGIDDNCNNEIDTDDPVDCLTWYLDLDQDAFGVEDKSLCLCEPWELYTATKPGDCDPDREDVYPDAPEQCNGVDDDCDTEVDEDFPDLDNDGLKSCVDDDDDGDLIDDVDDNCPWVGNDQQENNDDDDEGDACDSDDDNDTVPDVDDCAPFDSAIAGGFPDLCDGIDNNCDEVFDDEDDCSDEISCTVDTCLGEKGCSHTPDADLCNDDNVCTIDICNPLADCGYSNLPDSTPCGQYPNSMCFNGQCMCVPSCLGKSCGDNGCGGVCGTCGDGEGCLMGTCTPEICAGLSNFQNVVFVAPTGKDTDNVLGDLEHPFRTINAAISFAGSQDPKQTVYVSAGVYIESVQVADGVSICGGYNAPQGWTRNPAANVTEIQWYGGGNSDVVSVEATELQTDTLIDGFTVRAGTATTAGKDSIGMRIIDSGTGLTVANCKIIAGKGATGANGNNGAEGGPGLDGSPGKLGTKGSEGATCTVSGGKGGSSPDGGGKGGNGGKGIKAGCFSGRNGKVGGDGGGLGGDGGKSRCSYSDASGGDGNPSHEDPQPVACSADDCVEVAIGGSGFSFQGEELVANSGQNGSRGLNGSGGGGGGAGGGDYSKPTGDAWCGGTGGGGGGGGGGGYGGQSGEGGGASVALVAIEFSGTLDSCILIRGSGGVGGNGGAGGEGGKGGDGSAGGQSLYIGFGSGKGGHGGWGETGGKGGGGGGGAGGPSYGIIRIGDAVPNCTGLTFQNTGSGGTGGPGGSLDYPENNGQEGESGDMYGGTGKCSY
jgi:hypothetical protein